MEVGRKGGGWRKVERRLTSRHEDGGVEQVVCSKVRHGLNQTQEGDDTCK